MTSLSLSPTARGDWSAPSTPSTEQTCYSKASVAQLSTQEILGMSREALIGAVDAACLPFVDRARLAHHDRLTLIRLAYLARRCCRNQGY